MGLQELGLCGRPVCVALSPLQSEVGFRTSWNPSQGNINRKSLLGTFTIAALLTTQAFAQNVTNCFSTADPSLWLVAGGGATNATPFEIGPYYGLSYISVTSTSNSNGTYVVGMTDFTGFWTADYVFYLPHGATNISLTYSNFAADDRGMLLLNGKTIVATGIYYNGSQENPGDFVYTDGGSPQPYSSFAGTTLYGLVPGGVVANGFIGGAFNTLRAIVNNTYQGVVGPNLPLYGPDGTGVAVSGAVSYKLTPLVSLVKAVKPSFSSLSVGTNYQLQVSADLNTWTNQGLPFTATDTSMIYPQYWDVDNWNQLFFRLKVAP